LDSLLSLHLYYICIQQRIPVSDVIRTAVDITPAIEARRFTIKRYLADAAAQAAHMPRTMKTSYFEQMTLFNRLLAAEANVAIDV